jgi:hypothetical protein
LVVRGLINQLGMKDVEELVHEQFPEIFWRRVVGDEA